MPVADLKCDRCGEIYELKSVNGKIGRKISDGAYSTMIERITGAGNPDLFIMEYSREWQVVNLTLIPRFSLLRLLLKKGSRFPPKPVGLDGWAAIFYTLQFLIRGKLQL